MQERPDVSALLGAVGEFLLREVHPALGDKALQFRVLIASHLLSVIDGELAGSEARETCELASLRALLGERAPEGEALTQAQRREALTRLNRALCAWVREAPPEALAPAYEHLRRAMAATLAYANPRFDTALDLA